MSPSMSYPISTTRSLLCFLILRCGLLMKYVCGRLAMTNRSVSSRVLLYGSYTFSENSSWRHMKSSGMTSDSVMLIKHADFTWEKSVDVVWLFFILIITSPEWPDSMSGILCWQLVSITMSYMPVLKLLFCLKPSRLKSILLFASVFANLAPFESYS